MIVTDAHVAGPYLDRVSATLVAEGVSVSSLVLPAGEGTKSWEGLARLTEWLIGEGVERGDHVIALGGGVIATSSALRAASSSAAAPSSRFRRPCSRRSTAASAARLRSTSPPARI